jgi:phosphopantothenoylcysteine decarboxylase/phosphopantothenate--cysteine ligase
MNALLNKKILITAGPTREAIDPVRYISNHSTGKMGYAIADCLQQHGAIVHLISGPVNIKSSLPNESITHVVSALQMLEATEKEANDADIIIFTAAVSDYKCETIAEQKIKKQDDAITLKLVLNPDIAFTLAQHKKPHQIYIGFALETENGLENAMAKMKRKKFDCVVLNFQNEEGVGFGCDTNKIQIIGRDGSVNNFEMKPKDDVAQDIASHLIKMLEELNVQQSN